MRNAADVLGLFPTDFCDSYKLIHTAINLTDHNENIYRSCRSQKNKELEARHTIALGFNPTK